MKEFLPIDELKQFDLNPFELVTVASKEARNINKVRIVEKEQNPDEEFIPNYSKVYVEAVEKVLSNEIEFIREDKN